MKTAEPQAPDLDVIWHSALARTTLGLSPAVLATAYLDWAMHLAGSPKKQKELTLLALSLAMQHDAPEEDPRFADPAWTVWPYRLYAQGFRVAETWWHAATTGMKGVSPKNADITAFTARQLLDMASPTNNALTNPVVINRSMAENGQNLMRGAQYWMEDARQSLTDEAPKSDEFKVGETLAQTPGDVVMRNELVELIRYKPTTKKVRPEPILIVPAWIMKYYILDLTAQNSMVAYLRDQGFEVFILSWKNPQAEDAHLRLQDYVDLGLRAALDHICPDPGGSLHAVGYCLGGTLLSMTAAAMGRDGDTRLASLSLLASQVDFSDPGELGLFITDSQIAFLEDMMKTQGFLKAEQMAGAFQMLRSNDLIWSRMIHHYLLGERIAGNALMAWNADTTRMPAAMHSEYLRRLYLENALAKGLFEVDDRHVALTDIRCPVYCVGTEKDHVSPWKSVYKLLLLSDTDVTFTLTSGGHNGGILSEPGHPRRHFRIRDKTEGDPYRSADSWFADTAPQDGSWWLHWSEWLARRSGAPVAVPKRPGPGLGPAPGQYVFG